MSTEEPINRNLVEHQVLSKDWPLNDLAQDLHTWAGRMIVEFRLDIGTPALRLDQLPVSRYGHYHVGRNSFGLKGEVALNLRYVKGRPYWQVLGTLFHELLHFWQENHGTPGKRNYHNAEFREKAKSYGLVIDTKGVTDYEAPPTEFSKFLERHGVKMPNLPEKPPVRVKGKSKLRLWVCRCGVKVRVGRSDFQAHCDLCGHHFELQE